MPDVTVNGETVQAEEGELVFELLRRLEIEVPHFCYHPELSLAGACRMCMVEMDGDVDISCTRRVEDEMEIVTDSEEVAEARRGILEFMLVNHPLDCPVCDKGGECPLQDYTMGYGPAESRFHGNKRTFPKFDLGELLTQRQNRCILCYRCTRFYQEEGGREDFRVIQRGNDAFVGKQPGGQLESELSGNMVDICPTGTIVTKPYLHKSRPWENRPVESISGMDPIQAPIVADVRGDEIMRVRPQEDPDFPKPWIDDRVRFVHEYNSDEERRVSLPVEETYFDRFDALRETFEGAGSDRVAGLISADRTLEELYLFRRLFRRELDTENVACFPETGGLQVNATDFETLMESDFVLVVGTNFRNEYPMLTPMLRTAARDGAKLAYLSYWGNELTIEPDIYMRERPDELLKRITRLSEGKSDDPTDRAVLDALSEADNPVLVSCEGKSVGPELTRITLDWEARWEYIRLSPGGNAKAAERVFEDPVPVDEILQQAAAGQIECLWVYGMDLLRDYPNRHLVQRALEQLDTLAVSDYLRSQLTGRADRVLPLTTQFEEAGLMVNAEGRIRRRPRVTEHDERILSGRDTLSFWVYPEEDQAVGGREMIWEDCRRDVAGLPELVPDRLEEQSTWLREVETDPGSPGPPGDGGSGGGWTLFSEPYLFSSDRRAQVSPSVEGMVRDSAIECNGSDAEALGADRETDLTIRVNGTELERPVKITNNPPEGSLLVPWNLPGDETLQLFDSARTFNRVKSVESGSETVSGDD